MDGFFCLFDKLQGFKTLDHYLLQIGLTGVDHVIHKGSFPKFRRIFAGLGRCDPYELITFFDEGFIEKIFIQKTNK
jgi:hypothetical protein